MISSSVNYILRSNISCFKSNISSIKNIRGPKSWPTKHSVVTYHCPDVNKKRQDDFHLKPRIFSCISTNRSEEHKPLRFALIFK